MTNRYLNLKLPKPPIPPKHLLPVQMKIIKVSAAKKRRIDAGETIVLPDDDSTWLNKDTTFTLWDGKNNQWVLEKLEFELK